jgi:hypothetical protein
VRAIPERFQLYFVVGGYASILMLWGAMSFERRLVQLQDPIAANASSGMWAFGDALLGLGIGILLLIPTFFLLRVFARRASPFTLYSKITLAAAVTAPLALALLASGRLPHAGFFENNCVMRLLYSPFLIVILGMSRFLARTATAKRLLLYALSAESLTFFMAIALFLVESRAA